MSQTTVGTVNLAAKKRIVAIQHSVNFPGRFVAVVARPGIDPRTNQPFTNGYVYIDPNGTIFWNGDPNEGAYQVCRKVESAPGVGTLVFQFGVLAYGEDELD